MKYMTFIFSIILMSCTVVKADKIPANVLTRIENEAKYDHPDDERTQAYVIKNEKRAYVQLQEFKDDRVPEIVVRKIIRIAAASFPDDYSTQIFSVREECKAYAQVEKLKWKVPSNVLADARTGHPDDYSTQLYVIRSAMH